MRYERQCCFAFFARRRVCISHQKTRPYRGEAEIGRGDGRICRRQIARAKKINRQTHQLVKICEGRCDADACTRLLGLCDGGLFVRMVFHGGGGAVADALGDADALRGKFLVIPGRKKLDGWGESRRVVGVFVHVKRLVVSDGARMADGRIVVLVLWRGLCQNGRVRAVRAVRAAMKIVVCGRVITGDLAERRGTRAFGSLGAFYFAEGYHAMIAADGFAEGGFTFGLLGDVSWRVVAGDFAKCRYAGAHRGLGTFDFAKRLDAVVSADGFAKGGQAFCIGKSVGGNEEGEEQGERKLKSEIHGIILHSSLSCRRS